MFPSPPAWTQELFSIGVTGTNGKTSTVDFLASILKELAQPVARVTTLGMFVGEERMDVPPSHRAMLETLARCRTAGGRFAVLEVTSEVLARGFARAWPFRAAVFTNLTQDHLDAHANMEHYFACKAELFVTLPASGIAVLNGCDEVRYSLQAVLPKGVRELSYGVCSRGRPQGPLDLWVEEADITWQGTSAWVHTSPKLGGSRFRIVTRAIGEIFLENALAALASALALGAPLEVALRALANADPPTGRFEKISDAPFVIVDYAHTPDGLARTLATARRLTRGKIWLVFGAGGDRDRAKRPLMGAAAASSDRVLITSDNPRAEDPLTIAEAVCEGVPRETWCEIEIDRELAIGRAVLEADEADVIILAGKGHETTQSIAGRRHPFADAEVAKRALRRRHA